MEVSLRTKLMCSLGFIILVVLGTSTFVHIQSLRRDYLEAIEWRSEAVAQVIHGMVMRNYDLRLSQNIQSMLSGLSVQCIKIYQANKEKNIAHVAVINSSNVIAAHNDKALWNTPIQSPVLLDSLERQTLMTVLDGAAYHTLIPMFGAQDEYLGTIDIGLPKHVVDEKTSQLLLNSVKLFAVFVIVAFSGISVLVFLVITKPIKRLLMIGEKIAKGEFVHSILTVETTQTKHGKKTSADEILALTTVFRDMLVYLQDMAHAATRIATGDLSQYVIPQSQDDVLGNAFQNMSMYLNELATAATSIAAGNLHQEVRPKSEYDVLGNAFRTMVVQLRENLDRVHQEMTERTRAQEALQKLNEELEERVKTRTAELAKAKEAALEAQRAALEAQRAAEAAQRASEAANRAKSEFLANMSHELRTPLNAILGFAQLMTRSHTLASDQQENLSVIRRSGEHLLTLINQVLDLSKIEAGRTTLNETDFDLYGLLDELVDMFRLRAEEQRLLLIFDRSPEIPRYVRTDEIKLRQVLINLLNNALKFTEEGEVKLKIENCQLNIEEESRQSSQPVSGQASIRQYSQPVSGQASIIQFSISDTGPGIAPDEMEKLFEAFVQITTGRAAREGTGLGLPISRKFVQLMGGDIQVHSEVGHGTIFTFEIQCTVVDSVHEQPSSVINRVVALAPDQPCYRLLIVDDKRDNRQLLVKLLSALGPPPVGFDLREAENGQEAIDVWQAWEPHLIWMDMRMPVMDGYEAAKQIKTTTKGQATAIIALTASAFEEERAVVLSTGCDDFLRKPFKEADIFDLMHKHLGVRYVYEEHEEVKGQRSKVKGEEVLTPEALAALPAEWLAELKQAVLVADPLEIFPILEQIREQDAALAEALTTCIEQFDYEKILELLEKLNCSIA